MQMVTSATTATAAICLIVNERLTRKLALRQFRLNKIKWLPQIGGYLSIRSEYTRSLSDFIGDNKPEGKNTVGFGLFLPRKQRQRGISLSDVAFLMQISAGSSLFKVCVWH